MSLKSNWAIIKSSKNPVFLFPETEKDGRIGYIPVFEEIGKLKRLSEPKMIRKNLLSIPN